MTSSQLAQSMITHAGYRTLTAATVLQIRGDDARTWINGQVTQNVKDITSDHAVYALIVNLKGRVIADAWVSLQDDTVTVIVPSAAVDAVCEQFDKYIIMEDVEVVRRDDLRVISVQGPQSSIAAKSINGAIETNRFGIGGFDWLVASQDVDARIAQVRAALPGIAEIDADSWHAAYLLTGTPRFGADFGDKTYPQEAGLEKRAVSFQKGCYLGQEVICMLENRGQLSRRLVTIEVSGADAVRNDSEVATTDGNVIGHVTSSATLDDKVIAHAILKRASSNIGAALTTASRDARVTAIIGES